MDGYFPVAQYQSSSTPGKRYTVCVRDIPGKDIILTCNCPGWTRRCPDGTDASRTCKHVQQETRALEQYKLKGQSAQMAAPRKVQAQTSAQVVNRVQETVQAEQRGPKMRSEMPKVTEDLTSELREAREWLELDAIRATIERASRSL